jgi:transcriptional regulator with XRE-family HTH domain
VSCHPQVQARILRIGERIAQLRNDARLSLRELADLTGVSYATIQKIESNAIVPSVATVLKIAQGLGRKASFFLDESEEEEGTIVLTRRDERVVTHVPASRLTVEDIALTIRNSQLQATLLTIRPGGESGEEPLRHPGEEIKFCLKGRIEYRVDGMAYVLRAGDCLHFKSDVPHHWRNPGPETAIVFSVCTPPPFFSPASRERAAGRRGAHGTIGVTGPARRRAGRNGQRAVMGRSP